MVKWNKLICHHLTIGWMNDWIHDGRKECVNEWVNHSIWRKEWGKARAPNYLILSMGESWMQDRCRNAGESRQPLRLRTLDRIASTDLDCRVFTEDYFYQQACFNVSKKIKPPKQPKDDFYSFPFHRMHPHCIKAPFGSSVGAAWVRRSSGSVRGRPWRVQQRHGRNFMETNLGTGKGHG